MDAVEFFDMLDEERTPLTDELFALMDLDGSGTIEFDEFIAVLLTYCMYTKDDILRFCFDTFDKDKSNSIDENEGDLYRSTERGDYPPAQPWTTREEGTAPAPTLAAFDAGGVLLRHGWAPASAFAPSPMPAGAAAMAVAVGGCEPFMTTTTTPTTPAIGGAGPAAAIPMATPVAMA